MTTHVIARLIRLDAKESHSQMRMLSVKYVNYEPSILVNDCNHANAEKKYKYNSIPPRLPGHLSTLKYAGSMPCRMASMAGTGRNGGTTCRVAQLLKEVPLKPCMGLLGRHAFPTFWVIRPSQPWTASLLIEKLSLSRS